MKQTEIGLIPDDWEVKSIDEFATLTSGESPSKFKFVDTGIPYYKVEQMNNSLKYQNETPFYIEKLTCVQKGSIIFPKRGAAIETNKVRILSQDSFFDTNIMSVTLNETVNNEYFYYWLVKKELWQIADTTSIPQINNKHIKPLLVPIPPLPEQRLIAKALSDVDALISTTEKLIQKKKNIKQGSMQNLLTGKKRLPGFCPQTKSPAYKQTELGLIPEDWEVKNINKECTIKARIGWQGLKSTEYLDSGDYILITGTDFDSGFINWKSCSYVSKWRFDQDKNIQIKRGDVLITKDGTIGKVAFLNEIPMQGTLNSGVFVIRPKNPDKMDSVFLSLIFKSFWFDAFLEQITSGSTIVHLYQKDFVKFNFPLPSKEEQTAIANVLSSMDKEIETLNTKLEKYHNLKTAMMQQLLTGKIRLM